MPHTVSAPLLIWRLILAVTAGVGLALSLTGKGMQWWILADRLRYFTNLSTLAVFLFCSWWVVARGLGHTAHAAWARGLVTTMTVFTGLIYATLLGASYPDAAGWLTHIVVPIAMLADWLLADREHRIPQLTALITWAVAAGAYMCLYAWDAHIDGAPMYPFLNPSAPDWPIWAAAMVAGFLALSCALLGIAWMTRPAHIRSQRVSSNHDGETTV